MLIRHSSFVCKYELNCVYNLHIQAQAVYNNLKELYTVGSKRLKKT